MPQHSMDDETRHKLIADALDIWAPNWPRRVNRRQRTVTSKVLAVEHLLQAEDEPGNTPFISAYSFPDGHTREGNVPLVDTLFIDFDFEDGDYDPGTGDRDAWRRDLSHLLVRVRRVAKYLSDNGRRGWRAALSGHKGVHLFHDFQPIPQSLGSLDQYVTGVEEYASDLVDELANATGLSSLADYVDVTSADMGRLCRVPNTVHDGATQSFGEPRFCVPVSIQELSELSVDSYESLTAAPRAVPWDSRSPNPDASEVVERYVTTATPRIGYSSGSHSDTDYGRVEQYKRESNDNITLDDIPFLTSDRPCVWKFYERDDKWDYGAQSHNMEIYCIRELIEYKTPIPVIKDFLNSAPGYDEAYSEHLIKEVIARDYERFRTDTLLQKAPEFCGYDDCKRCQRIIEEQNINV